jgi:3-phenylpropionate/cinnamic acid dioxygenase small subunit
VGDAAPGPGTTTFGDWLAINALLMTYAEHVDTGRFVEVAALFEHATYRIEHAGTGQVSSYEGAAAVRGFCEQTRLYPDGTPRTRHVITNVVIETDGDSGTARSYATVFQQTDAFPLQPIASGRYLDRFERVGGAWRFADRLITGFLLGDRTHHVAWADGGTPDGGGS